MIVLSVLGTRPEAIKMAPVIRELARHQDRLNSLVCVSAQHRGMLDQVLALFQIVPDYDLNLMKERQTLTELTARVLTGIEPILQQVKPDWVLVQGDTTTVMAVSLAAFYHNIKVGHVEAGLRTYHKRAPFPEEINRRVTSVLADLHFAPTEGAKQALLAEGYDKNAIVVTGNTVIDALLWAQGLVREKSPMMPAQLEAKIAGKRLILVTAHRRESFDGGLEQICLALRDLVEQHEDICIVYAVHPNPQVQETVFRLLKDIERIYLVEPLAYAAFIWLMDQAYLIITDSGGIQEEAPSLGKPVLVTRDTTERPEGIQAGNIRLTGAHRVSIVNTVHDLLTDTEQYQQMAQVNHVYGDGLAANRIVQALLEQAH